MQGLTDNTLKIVKKISLLPCISKFTLIGGTALSLQINKRLSEDLDFCIWSKNLKTDKPTVDWPLLEKELKTIGNIEAINILGFDQVNFKVNGVKLSFITKQNNLSPVTNPVKILNNIKAADIVAIGVMKIELILRRSEYKDYYDIYSILKEGKSLRGLLTEASKYSNRLLKTRDALQFLMNGANFKSDANFHLLKPKYLVESIEIQNFIKDKFEKEFLPV